MKFIRKALTIAGSDSGAGAGIQADLKTFAALGVYGTSAITAITAQNTVGVTQVLALSPKLVGAQIDAVIDDIGAHALKTYSPVSIAVLPSQHRAYFSSDRVIHQLDLKSGAILKTSIPGQLVVAHPNQREVTPNIPEAEELTGMELRTPENIT